MPWFDGVAAGRLDLAGDEDRLRLRDVDGVAVLQRDVQRHVAGLELIEVDADDLRFAPPAPSAAALLRRRGRSPRRVRRLGVIEPALASADSSVMSPVS